MALSSRQEVWDSEVLDRTYGCCTGIGIERPSTQIALKIKKKLNDWQKADCDARAVTNDRDDHVKTQALILSDCFTKFSTKIRWQMAVSSNSENLFCDLFFLQQ